MVPKVAIFIQLFSTNGTKIEVFQWDLQSDWPGIHPFTGPTGGSDRVSKGFYSQIGPKWVNLQSDWPGIHLYFTAFQAQTAWKTWFIAKLVNNLLKNVFFYRNFCLARAGIIISRKNVFFLSNLRLSGLKLIFFN